MIRIILLTLLLVVALAGCGDDDTYETLYPVSNPIPQSIPDKNFERALIDKGIDKDAMINGILLNNNLESIEELNISNYGIKDLTGIEYFENLKELNC